MMSLKVLKDNRDALLLSEVAALLHDVGKFCNLHIEAHTGGQRRWSNDHAYKAVIDSPGAVIKLSKAAASLKKPDVLNNVLNAQSPKAADFISTNLKDFLQNNTINLFGESYSLAELIMLGTPGFAGNRNRAQLLDGKPGWLAAVLGVCHSEAHVDKEDPPGQGNQTLPYVFISTAFGYEEQKVVIGTSPESLDNRLQKLPVPPKRDQILREFSYGLGDTRRPVNEVTLSDWAWIVAALFKPAIAVALLTNQQPGIRQWKSHDLRWRLLRVNFDVLGLYAKAVKIADLLGYQNVVDEACAKVKKLIEEEYPLGNEIYRDSTGIYFTFPDLDLPADLAQEICRCMESVEMELAPRIAVTVGDGTTATDQLKSILGKARREALETLAQPFDSQHLSACWQQQQGKKADDGKKKADDGQWEVCPVCRLRLMPEKAEACEHCIKRRSSRIEAWKQNPAQTIWIDEIADHNDRVALIVGRFGLDDWLSGDLVQTMLVKAVQNNPKDCVPKNPSPARLRRVWETCQRFWTETVEQEILTRHDYSQGDALRCVRYLIIPDQKSGWKENVPYDGTVDGKAISLLWCKEAQHFITISNLQLSGGIKPGREIRLDDPDKPGRQFTITVQGTMPIPGAMGAYAPYLPLLASPDQFLALVPAADALEIAEKIRAAYAEQFGKVQNRLPLFLGLVFFLRKTPLLAVMDTVRRMLAAPLKEESWTVAQDVTIGQIAFKNGVEWNISTVMGDGTTPDSWYPYFFVTNGKPNCQRCFQLRKEGDTDPQKVGSVSKKYADRWLVHMSDLKQDDVVQVTPSRFAYLFLENTARRFRFDPERDVMLLDELPRLMKMWNDLRSSGITDTSLRNVQALLERKGETWGRDSKEFEHLAHTTLKEAGLFERKDQNGNPLSDVVTPQDVVSGRFARCLELHLYILRLKIKES